MKSTATTVSEYIAALPADRQATIEKVREVILANLDSDYEEGIQYGMIGYFVPYRVFPEGYHCKPKQPLPFVGLASQKNYCSLYLMGLYCGVDEGDESQHSDAAWFRKAWESTGKKLDMGKGCLRFKSADDLALDVVGESIRRVPAMKFVSRYKEVRAAMADKGSRRKS